MSDIELESLHNDLTNPEVEVPKAMDVQEEFDESDSISYTSETENLGCDEYGDVVCSGELSQLSMDEPEDQPSQQSVTSSQFTPFSQASNISDESYRPTPPKKRKIPLEIDIDPDILDYARAGEEMLTQLKHKLNSADITRSEQITLLTLVPSSWSVRKTSVFLAYRVEWLSEPRIY